MLAITGDECTVSSWHPSLIPAGDFNLDGFPDVMFSTKLGTSTFHTWLLYNEVCSSSSADAACLRRGRSMSFSMRKTLLSDSSVLGAFVDMGERVCFLAMIIHSVAFGWWVLRADDCRSHVCVCMHWMRS